MIDNVLSGELSCPQTCLVVPPATSEAKYNGSNVVIIGSLNIVSSFLVNLYFVTTSGQMRLRFNSYVKLFLTYWPRISISLDV